MIVSGSEECASSKFILRTFRPWLNETDATQLHHTTAHLIPPHDEQPQDRRPDIRRQGLFLLPPPLPSKRPRCRRSRQLTPGRSLINRRHRQFHVPNHRPRSHPSVRKSPRPPTVPARNPRRGGQSDQNLRSHAQCRRGVFGRDRVAGAVVAESHGGAPGGERCEYWCYLVRLPAHAGRVGCAAAWVGAAFVSVAIPEFASWDSDVFA